MLLPKSIYILFTFRDFIFWFSVLLLQYNIDYVHVSVEVESSWKIAQSWSSAESLQLWNDQQQVMCK